jgi:hypothetical protein
VITHLHTAGGLQPLGPLLEEWTARLTARGRAMLAGAAALDAYLNTGPGKLPPT